jgi:nucleoside-diphosphate-sugar epimerase
VHLAWTTSHGKFWNDPLNLDWVAATLRIARAFRAAGGARFVGVGTCFEYDLTLSDAPLIERASPTTTGGLYGVAKDACRRLLESFAAEVDMSFAWARIFHLYGAGEDPRRLVSDVATKVAAGDIALCSSGRQKRDFMHVADAGAAIAKLATSDVGGPVNIASGEATTVGDVARLVGATLRRPDLVVMGGIPDRAGDPPSILADVARLRDEVGFRPRFALAAGLEDALRQIGATGAP